MLSNLQTDKEMLLQVIIVGQPNLRNKIQAPGLEQFAQRISASYHMSAMTQDETASYIIHRLKKAGGLPSLFATDLIKKIFEVSCGIPRTINMLCDAMLVYGYADRVSVLTRDLLDQVIQDKGGMGVFTRQDQGIESQPATETATGIDKRIRELEQQVSALTAAMDTRLKDTQSRADFCRDALVARLTRLYAAEKKKNTNLVYRYGMLRERYTTLHKQLYDSSKPILLENIVQ
jgi:general secretion pathway protein A